MTAMTTTSTQSDSIDELLEEPTTCPDCEAGLTRSEDDEAVVLDCPKCETTLYYPK